MAKPAGDVALAVSAHLRMRNTQTLILSLYRVILAVFLSYQNQTQEGQIDTTTVIEKFDKCLPICACAIHLQHSSLPFKEADFIA